MRAHSGSSQDQIEDSPPILEHASAAESPADVEYSLSAGIAARMLSLNVAIAFTSYQSGILYFFGATARGPHLHQSGMSKPMGLHLDGAGRLALAAGAQILRFENVLEAHERINDGFDGR